jgi:hypothetical protein
MPSCFSPLPRNLWLTVVLNMAVNISARVADSDSRKREDSKFNETLRQQSVAGEIVNKSEHEPEVRRLRIPASKILNQNFQFRFTLRVTGFISE